LAREETITCLGLKLASVLLYCAIKGLLN
jgi:hypothetical protein